MDTGPGLFLNSAIGQAGSRIQALPLLDVLKEENGRELATRKLFYVV